MKTLCAFWGYSMRISCGEIEAYPKGKRGDASIFEDDTPAGRESIVATVKAAACRAFETAVDGLPAFAGNDTPHAQAALCAWFYERGATWKSDLYRAWMSGNYQGSAVSGSLQLLRNSARGFDIVESLNA